MSARNYGIISSTDALKALVDKLMAENKTLGFDLETGYHGPDRAKGALDMSWDSQFIAGFSITNGPNWARYVPVAHDVPGNLPEEQTWEIIKPVLETLPSVAHNAKFEIKNLRALDRKGRGPAINLNCIGDTQLDSYVLAETPSHGLKDLVKAYYGHQMATLKSLFPELSEAKITKVRFNVFDLTAPVISYACEDAAWCLSLWDDRHEKAVAQRKFITDMEHRIMLLLCDVEDDGHAVDWESMTEAYSYADPFLERMTEAARGMLGTMAGEDLSDLNLNSSPQMQTVLYDKIGLSTTRRSKKTGNMSTDKIAMERLSREHPAVKKVLECREVKNLRDRMKKWTTQYAQSHDRRVHASFNQIVVDSGRFSANDPAVQQLPKDWRWSVFPKVNVWDDEHWIQVLEKATFGKHYWSGNFRDFMVSAPGTYLMGFDYSQIELRALAGMSQEPSLLKAFDDDEDIHTLTAAMMLGIPVEAVGEKERAIGKTMNFALVYGMSAKSLAERLAISIDEAESLYAQYFANFTLVTDWMKKKKATGLEYGYVETHWGRKVVLWGLQSDNSYQRGTAERLTINAPVQGTAADIMKIAMLKAQKVLQNKGWWRTKVRMINNIHDALVFEADDDIDPAELRAVLEAAVVWKIDGFPKIKADWELGLRWGTGMAKWKDDKHPEWNGERWVLVGADGIVAEPEEDDDDEDLTPEDFETPAEPVREEGEQVIVELTSEPEREGFSEFLSLLTNSPGYNVVTLRHPDGELTLEKWPTSLGVEDQNQISLLLGGAKVFSPVDVMDAEAFSEGMDL